MIPCGDPLSHRQPGVSARQTASECPNASIHNIKLLISQGRLFASFFFQGPLNCTLILVALGSQMCFLKVFVHFRFSKRIVFEYFRPPPAVH